MPFHIWVDLIITKWAGKLTPNANVEVVQRIGNIELRNKHSIKFLSFKHKFALWNPIPFWIDWLNSLLLICFEAFINLVEKYIYIYFCLLIGSFINESLYCLISFISCWHNVVVPLRVGQNINVERLSEYFFIILYTLLIYIY